MAKPSIPQRVITEDKIVIFRRRLLKWFQSFGRHYFPWRSKGLTAYQIVIAEVLLQRTKADVINGFYPHFLADFPDWHSIVEVDVHALEARLKPLGLYRQRAKRMKELAQAMVNRDGKFPASRIELEQIPLLGQYIANAVELQLFNRPSPLIDVNMARVLERYFGERYTVDIRYDKYLQNLAKRIVKHPESKDISWAIIDFAAKVCKARKPLCIECPLSTNCSFALSALSFTNF